MKPKFNDKDYQEILRVRERLDKIRIQDYGYPEQPNDPEQPEEPWRKKQWGIINQLRGMVQFLYSKETERRANASKRKHKDNI